ncbi:MAG: GtrA family protein [Lachnospiraceae bacterium]|nr:GtrA family protein [Lachnospiraceae bacterium]
MIKAIKRVLDLEQSRFIIVGVMNTIIGTLAMLIAYNIFHMGYWLSSALNYIIGSIFSYFANKYFTFKAENKSKMEIVRFVINIAVCYLLAYGIAQPIMDALLKDITLSRAFMDQISMFFGMGIFVVLNYFGQKFFVFKKMDNN